jgi:hypothetical protein
LVPQDHGERLRLRVRVYERRINSISKNLNPILMERALCVRVYERRINSISECQKCLAERAELNRRRQHEQKLVHDNDRTFIDQGQAW